MTNLATPYQGEEAIREITLKEIAASAWAHYKALKDAITSGEVYPETPEVTQLKWSLLSLNSLTKSAEQTLLLPHLRALVRLRERPKALLAFEQDLGFTASNSFLSNRYEDEGQVVLGEQAQGLLLALTHIGLCPILTREELEVREIALNMVAWADTQGKPMGRTLAEVKASLDPERLARIEAATAAAIAQIEDQLRSAL